MTDQSDDREQTTGQGRHEKEKGDMIKAGPKGEGGDQFDVATTHEVEGEADKTKGEGNRFQRERPRASRLDVGLAMT